MYRKFLGSFQNFENLMEHPMKKNENFTKSPRHLQNSFCIFYREVSI